MRSVSDLEIKHSFGKHAIFVLRVFLTLSVNFARKWNSFCSAYLSKKVLESKNSWRDALICRKWVFFFSLVKKPHRFLMWLDGLSYNFHWLCKTFCIVSKTGRDEIELEKPKGISTHSNISNLCHLVKACVFTSLWMLLYFLIPSLLTFGSAELFLHWLRTWLHTENFWQLCLIRTKRGDPWEQLLQHLCSCCSPRMCVHVCVVLFPLF